MTEQIDLEKHRQTISEKLKTLSKEIEDNAAGNEAVTKLARLLLEAVDHLEAYLKVHEATTLLFQKLILAAPRLSNDYDGFREMCRQLEEQLGYYTVKQI